MLECPWTLFLDYIFVFSLSLLPWLSPMVISHGYPLSGVKYPSNASDHQIYVSVSESDWGPARCVHLHLDVLLFFSHSVVSGSLWLHEQKHSSLPCSSLSPGDCSNSCPLSWWCHPTILSHPLLLLPSIFSSIRVFSKELAFCIRWPKYWGFSFSISPSNEYSVLISFRTVLNSLLSKQLSRVFSNTTVQKHQFFCTQPSLWSNSHIHTWLLENP